MDPEARTRGWPRWRLGFAGLFWLVVGELLTGCADMRPLQSDVSVLKQQLSDLTRELADLQSPLARADTQAKEATRQAQVARAGADQALAAVQAAEVPLDAGNEKIDRMFRKSLETDEPRPERVATAPPPPPPPPPASDVTAGDNAPAADIASVQRMLESLPFGNIAFNIPSALQVQRSAAIQVELGIQASIEELKQRVDAEGDKLGARIRIADRMLAQLTGPAFQITSVTPETQAITNNTTWRWNVVPLTAGQQELDLALSALVMVDGQSTPLAIKTFHRVLVVNPVDSWWGDFLKKNWQFLCSAIVIPLFIWLWKAWRQKPGGPGRPATEPDV